MTAKSISLAKGQFTLTTFEDKIEPDICERGYDFYTEGRIMQVFHITEPEWRATVQGYDDHAVMVTLQKTGLQNGIAIVLKRLKKISAATLWHFFILSVKKENF